MVWGNFYRFAGAFRVRRPYRGTPGFPRGPMAPLKLVGAVDTKARFPKAVEFFPNRFLSGFGMVWSLESKSS